MITATSWCGITYALLGGQPMVSTGMTPYHTELLLRTNKLETNYHDVFTALHDMGASNTCDLIPALLADD